MTMLSKPNPPNHHRNLAAPHLVRRAVAVAMAASLIGSPALAVGTDRQLLLGAGRPLGAQDLILVADPFDPEVILPGRVDAALHRTLDSVDRSVAAVDDRRWPTARRSLAAARTNFDRAHRSVVRQVRLVVDPEAEDESTAGPDSALAGLNVEQVSVAVLVGLFDGVRRKVVVQRIRSVLATAQRNRMALISTIVGLDPEEAGAAYADSLADTVPQYADEVATIREALVDDRLSRRARVGVRAALARSIRANTAMTRAFGGGE